MIFNCIVVQLMNFRNVKSGNYPYLTDEIKEYLFRNTQMIYFLLSLF